MNETGLDVFESKQGHSDSGSSSLEVLKRIHDEIDAIRTADRTVGGEMNKIKVVCEPPPITPPCHPVEEPADPAVLSIAVGSMNSAGEKLRTELDTLRPNAASGGKKFEHDFNSLFEQVQKCSEEITVLKSLTTMKELGEHSYDKQGILTETEKIEKLAKGAEKTRKLLEKDLSH